MVYMSNRTENTTEMMVQELDVQACLTLADLDDTEKTALYDAIDDIGQDDDTALYVRIAVERLLEGDLT